MELMVKLVQLFKPSVLLPAFALTLLFVDKLISAPPTQEKVEERNVVTNIENPSQGWRMIWRVPAEQLDHACQWQTTSKPALGPDEAIAQARRYLKSIHQASERPVESVALRHVRTAALDCFAYLVEFSDVSTDPDHQGAVVVLLNGDVLRPVIERFPAKKSADLWPDDDAVVDFAKKAASAYVFAIRSDSAKRPDEKKLRSIDAEARQRFIDILNKHGNWYHGLMTWGGTPYGKGSVGILFRRGGDELILYFNSECGYGCLVEGNFQNKEILGILNECASPDMDDWKERYASAETNAD